MTQSKGLLGGHKQSVNFCRNGLVTITGNFLPRFSTQMSQRNYHEKKP